MERPTINPSPRMPDGMAALIPPSVAREYTTALMYEGEAAARKVLEKAIKDGRVVVMTNVGEPDQMGKG